MIAVLEEVDVVIADAILIRPDGYAAWAASGSGSLADSLRTWFGEPVAALAA